MVTNFVTICHILFALEDAFKTVEFGEKICRHIPQSGLLASFWKLTSDVKLNFTYLSMIFLKRHLSIVKATYNCHPKPEIEFPIIN